MNQEREMEAYGAQVVTCAERTFGAFLGRALLETYAREAVLDLWLSGPAVTRFTAELALNQLHTTIARPTYVVTEHMRLTA
jgi:hypothetical protein